MKSTRRKNSKAAPVGVSREEILPEYDFSRSRPNKFAPRYSADSMVVVLEPDVAAAFPTASQANEALRVLAGLIQRDNAPEASLCGGRRVTAIGLRNRTAVAKQR